MIKPAWLLLGLSVSWAGLTVVAGAEIIPATVAEPAWMQTQTDEFNFAASNLASLRRLNEGALYLIKRYAMLEALITANDQGRTENQAFAIGAASMVPGVGQFINGDTLQGGLLLFASGLSSATIQQLDYTRRQRSGTDELLPAYYATLILHNSLVSYAMLHATNASYRAHRDRTAAMWTGAASVLPGVGQAINGNWWEAGAFLAAYAVSLAAVASFEEAIYPPGNDRTYLVRNPGPRIDLAWLPGGGAISITTDW